MKKYECEPCGYIYDPAVGAVSYTHLDVYKRQLLFCLNTPDCLEALVTICYRFLHIAHAFYAYHHSSQSINTGPVSYTHLFSPSSSMVSTDWPYYTV